jgi:cytochrome c-type biogenesis protein CcmF
VIGQFLLVVGFVAAAAAAIAGTAGGLRRDEALVAGARRAIYALAGVLVVAFVLVEVAFLRSDFSLSLVARNSSLDTPTFYKFTAIWSSQAGSLLLWVTMLALYAALVLRAVRGRLQAATPFAIGVFGTVAMFFLGLLVFLESPFTALPNPPADGNGLNPLLRNEMMALHPPLLYAGYVGFSVPFAFAIGALITRDTGAEWIRATRRSAMLAWTFLAAGLLLGSYWGYSELGWGGYWGWDPVENAALMPWLTGTAFIHSVMVQERRGRLRVWNVTLIIGTFVLALTGTLLVRSGILQSVHAFGDSTLGVPFTIFVAFVVLGSAALVASRLDALRSPPRGTGVLSRETVFLFNNVALVGLCLVVLWGTFFPLIAEAVTGRRASVGPPWFASTTTPLGFVLVFLAAVGPLVVWRRTPARALIRALRFPVAVAATTAMAAVALSGAESSVPALGLFALAALVLGVVAQEYVRGARVARRLLGGNPLVSLRRAVMLNPRRYGGYLVHAGMALLFAGAAASSAYDVRSDMRLRPGATATIDGYAVTYRQPTATLLDDPSDTGATITLGAVLDVRKGEDQFTLAPRRNYYASGDAATLGATGRFFDGESTTEVDIDTSATRDVWAAVQPDMEVLRAAIAEADRRFPDATAETQVLILSALVERYARQSDTVTIRLIVFPFVIWLYVGGATVLAGAAVALWPRRPRPREQAPAPLRVPEPEAVVA